MKIEDKLYEWLGTDWGAGPGPPMNESTVHTQAAGYEEVYRIGNDGVELWIGTPNKWYWHTNRQGARELWWFILRWWVGEWFGLRRKLWYALLRRRVDRHKKRMREATR
jgi:hypothetical protein